MKNRLLIFYLFIYVTKCFSQTNISNGNVSGLWEKSKSPYQIFGDITIPNGQTLTIEKGVRIEFQGHYKLNVQGRLLAMGDKADSIFFTSKDNIVKWSGIRFENIPETNDSSKIVYCIVENSYAYSGQLPNSATYDDYGGGIFIRTSKLVINNSIIRNNKAYTAGGIYCSYKPIIQNTKIINNYADEVGGLYVDYGSEPQIAGCIISNNSAKRTAGMRIGYGTALFVNNTICKNISNDSLYASIITSGSPKFINNIFYYNYPKNILIDNGLNPQFINCDIEGGISSIIDTHPTVKGFFDGIYNNNIEEPPMFVDDKNGNYQLAASPCINSGNTSSWCVTYNSDIISNPRVYNDSKARIDIGAYEYQGTTPNRAPYTRKMNEQYFLRSQKSKLVIYYFDADSGDKLSFKVKTSNIHVSASIINVNDSTISMEINPESNWIGECYIFLTIDDNNNFINSVCTDSIKVYISNRFKGEINSNVVFQDTVKVIGDIIINDSGSLVIQPGSFIEFQDYYKIKVFGKMNILGTKQNNVILNSLDSSVVYKNNVGLERGWGGIEFNGINRTDTMFINYCLLKNTGLNKELNYANGTVSILNSRNIHFYNCSFESNFFCFTDKKNSGIYAENSSNIQIKNCTFSNGYTLETLGTYVNSFSSNLIIDSCRFYNTYDVFGYNWHCIYCDNSFVQIRNSYFSNNSCRFLISSYSGGLIVEYCTMKNNVSNGIEIMTNGSLIRNNVFINNNIAIRSGATAYIVNNIIAYNKLRCGCSNFYGGTLDLDGAGKTIVANNTIVNNFQDSNGSTIYASYCSPIIVNNILWGNNREGVDWYNGAGLGIPGPIVKNNVIKGGYYDNSYINFTYDPLFRLKDSLDFQLLNNSPCINKGLTDTVGLYLPLNDLLGNKRIDLTYKKLDLGAYEYNGTDIPNVPNSVIIQTLKEIEIYPNPTNSSLYLPEEFNGLQYSILNFNGQVVQSGIITNSSISVNNLINNTYILIINNNIRYLKAMFIKL